MYLSILILPFLGSFVSGFMGRKIGVTGAHIITCTCLILSSILATFAFYEVGICGSPVSIYLTSWVDSEIMSISSMRVCMRDEDEIPVSPDSGGYLDRYGQRRWSIKVRKHDIISLPIQAINKSTKLWGPDASVFRPERWESPPHQIKAIPGLYSNILTFLNGNPLDGNRACIGYKFALLEMKIFLYVLLKDLDFSIDPSIVIEKKVK